MNPVRIITKLPIWLFLGVIFVIELFKSSVSVAWAVLNPKATIHPAIIAYPLELKTDIHIATLANMISLTPGTTSLHVSEDRSTLYIHVLNLQDEAGAVEGIKSTFERRLLASER